MDYPNSTPHVKIHLTGSGIDVNNILVTRDLIMTWIEGYADTDTLSKLDTSIRIRYDELNPPGKSIFDACDDLIAACEGVA